ncbi:hypothetical protein GCK32_003100 [Trichostrongylus colubriformis]|uniref:Uncharacterized protein n=1 Tax=Trichostrongylus colubriformis TaxID=6319 RepID=A0AAN8FQ93_TRICO
MKPVTSNAPSNDIGTEVNLAQHFAYDCHFPLILINPSHQRLPPFKQLEIGNGEAEQLSKALCGTSDAKKMALLTRLLPDSMRTGRATVAVPGGQPRLQTTAQVLVTPTTTDRRSASVPRESAEVVEMTARIVQLEGELLMETESVRKLKNELALKDQTREGQDIIKVYIIQTALDEEKGKSSMMQVALNAKDSEIAQLKHELCQRMEDFSRLTSQLAAKRDEDIRLLHNTVVDLKMCLTKKKQEQ